MGSKRYTIYRKGNTMNKKTKLMLQSYGRSILGAATALYASGVTDLETLAWSLVGAIVPVVLRALNPNDPAFGRMPATADVEAAAKAARPVKKKAAAKQ